MNQFEYYFKEIRQKQISMEEIEFYISKELKRLNLKKSDLADRLGITMPTLKSKINNPQKFTILDLIVMRNHKIDIEPFIKVIEKFKLNK